MVDEMVFFPSENHPLSPECPDRDRRRVWVPGGLLWLTLAAVLGPGCGDGKPPLYPAEGQVFVEKKPAKGALVWLHPVTPPEGKAPPRPHARVEADGSFRMGTYTTGDGVPPGKYRVTISWTEEVKSGDMDGKNLLPDRYQSPEKSGLPVVEIKEGTNQLPPFHLTR
jgi:hypothetical protein